MNRKHTKSRPYHGAIVLAKAHDVRHLAICLHCNGLLDRREAVPAGSPKARGYWHGRCYIALHGMACFERLPGKVLARLTLGDIGVKAMRAVLAKAGEAQRQTDADKETWATLLPLVQKTLEQS